MRIYIFRGANGWYWRGERVNACGPFETMAEATRDALKMDTPADEFFQSGVVGQGRARSG